MKGKKLKLLVLGTGNVTLDFIRHCLNLSDIELLGNIPDCSLDDNNLNYYKEELEKVNCITLPFNDYSLSKADIIYSIEYRKIIEDCIINKYFFVNCHGGILPQWRGFSCNAWAIINGAKEIGYSVHRMNGKLDDGDLFFIKKIPIDSNQTYADVHEKMIQSIINETPQILIEIAGGKRKGIPQKGSFAYCNKFSREMGMLSNFNVPSVYLYNLYRCMAKPLGSGLFFQFKGVIYNVGVIKIGSDYGVTNYIGVPGKIINISDEALWIKTLDNCVLLSDIRDSDNRKVNLYKTFRNGNFLNF